MAFSTLTLARSARTLQVLILLGQRGLLGLLQILLDLDLPFLVHLDLWRQQRRHGDKLEVRVADQLAGQPQERLLEVVVGLGRNVVVLVRRTQWLVLRVSLVAI